MRHLDPHPRRPLASVTGALVAAIAAVLVLAAPAAAKEGMMARLDAPIPMGVPGGTELLVGVTVTVLDETGAQLPVEGTPVYVRLTGPGGTSTRAAGAGDRTPGHYTMRIVVPEGGARDIEIGIHGSSDLAMTIVEDPFAVGGVTATTAQVAPPLPPALTPAPRPAAPTAATVAVAPPAAVPAESDRRWLLPAALVAGTALVVALVGAVVGRRRRTAARRAPTSSAPHSA